MPTAGTVEHVAIKRKRKEPMISQCSISLRENYGIEGDAHARSDSPRQILLIAQETLNKFALQPGQLRENIITLGLDHSRLHSGSLVKMGDDAIIRITFLCETCTHIGPFPFKSRHLQEERGYLGVVLKSGVVRPGDRAVLLPDRYPSIPETLYERFVWLVGQIPSGKVMSYRLLMNTIGGSPSYYRVLPAYIKRAAASNPRLPVHRLLDTQGRLIPHVPHQSDLLRREGILTEHSQVDAAACLWQPELLYFKSELEKPTVPKEYTRVPYTQSTSFLSRHS